MAIHGFSPEERFEAIALGVMEGLGLKLTIGTDFNEFAQYVAESRPDHPIGDPFNPEMHNLTPETACWIVGRDETGKIVHLHALRLLPTATQSVAEYFRRNFHGFSPPELEIDFDRSHYRACPDARRMFGNVVYSGEVWLDGASGRYRGTGLIGYLMRFAMLTAMKRFSADYFLGFVARPVAFKGVTLHFGYLHADPLALRWHMVGENKPLEGTMVYMNTEDMRYIMDLPAAEYEALAA